MSIVLNKLSDNQLIDLLNSSKVGVLPTDTLYGLACRAVDGLAVQRLYDLKRRHHKPGTIIAASISQLVDLGFKARYLKAVESYWPAPLSIVIPCVDLQYLHQGIGSIPVRLSADKTLNKLIVSTGPLLTSSANLPDKPPANNISEAQAYFTDKVDFYVDGGDLSKRLPSTVIRVVDDAIEVLRKGAAEVRS